MTAEELRKQAFSALSAYVYRLDASLLYPVVLMHSWNVNTTKATDSIDISIVNRAVIEGSRHHLCTSRLISSITAVPQRCGLHSLALPRQPRPLDQRALLSLPNGHHLARMGARECTDPITAGQLSSGDAETSKMSEFELTHAD